MIEREVGAVPGPKFLKGDGDDVLFAYRVDASSIVGPRAATAQDQADHPEAWRVFCKAEGIEPLDRDAKDGADGSLPQPEAAPKRRARKAR